MERTVTVRGTGRLSLPPDLIRVQLSIIKKSKDYAKAMNESAELLAALRAAIAPLGFSEDDLKTVSFGVSAEYDSVRENGVYKSVFAGFVCTHALKLEFGYELEKLSAVLSAISLCVAEPELSVGFTVKDRETAVDELLKRAANEARSRAETLAAASGAELGSLVSIEHDPSRLDFDSPTRFSANLRLAAKCESADLSMSPDDVELTESAVFVWEIRS